MKVINIGIVAHIDAEKTSFTENFLFKSGAINVLCEVNSKNTTMDNLEMERSRGITIRESTASFIWNGVKISILIFRAILIFSLKSLSSYMLWIA